MQITAIKTLVVNAQMRNWVFVRVETDQPGLYGWGEATLEWKTRRWSARCEDLAPLLIGRDPREIEQACASSPSILSGGWASSVTPRSAASRWRCGTSGARSSTCRCGACWAAGRVIGQDLHPPGLRRHDHGVREHGSQRRGGARAEVVSRGYRALKVVFIPYTHYTASPKQLDHVANMMQGLREAVGDDVEIMIDFHGRCASTSVALQYIAALAPAARCSWRSRSSRAMRWA